jgi:hypothetical protein
LRDKIERIRTNQERAWAWRQFPVTVASARKGGQIEFVELQSLAGGECRFKNPWPDTPVTLYRNGKKAEDLSGASLAFSTAKGETIVVVPKGATPPRKRVS